MLKHLLVVDDEPGHRLMVRAVLEDAGWKVSESASGEEALTLVEANPQNFHVVLLDMRMPGMDGQATLHALHGICPELPIVMLTAYGTVGAAVEAMKQGAFDYLTKPADNDELILTLTRAHDFYRLSQENTRLHDYVHADKAKEIIGSSALLKGVFEFIAQAGPSEATVMISGESGTGKELIANALHRASPRKNQPLIKVNCAALPDQLLESELFGYQKGAFTGAVKDKPGRFQLASGGTLFLDEIGEFPLELQAKLLRALQEKVIEPLGSVKPISVDVRIITASNKNLKEAVDKGTLREDLYFRLNVLEIESPPLRERIEDIPLLTHHLLQKLILKNRKTVRGVSPAFLDLLSNYSWPGNIRELENILERSLILSRADTLQVDTLPDYILQGAQNSPARPNTSLSSTSLSTPLLPVPPLSGTSLPSTSLPSHFSPIPPLPTSSPLATSLPALNTLEGVIDLPVSSQQTQAFARSSPSDTVPNSVFTSTASQNTPSHHSQNTPPHHSQNTPPHHSQNTPPHHSQNTPPHHSLSSPLELAEKEALLDALHKHKGHREKTAESLGISRRTLQYKLKKYELTQR